MASPERGPKNFTEEILIEQGSNAVVLTTTKKEAFVGLEEALGKKKKEVRKGNIALPFRAVGIAGMLGGVGFIIAGGSNLDSQNIVIGLSAFVAGTSLIYVTQKYFDRAKLAEKQIEKIEPLIKNDASVGQPPR